MDIPKLLIKVSLGIAVTKWAQCTLVFKKTVVILEHYLK